MIVIRRGRCWDNTDWYVKSPGQFDGFQVRFAHPAAELRATFKKQITHRKPYQPNSSNLTRFKWFCIACLTYGIVFIGKSFTSVQRNSSHLSGSALTGSPRHLWTSIKKSTRSSLSLRCITLEKAISTTSI